MVDRSRFYEIDDVSIFDLQLDADNPRIRRGVDQHDCIGRIADDRDAFLRLMKDIAAYGLSPEHILLSTSAEGKLIVRDGNRRVSALKLLNRPDLALPDGGLRNIVAKIAGAAATPIVDKVDCLVFDDEATLLDYLRRKHTGENGGIGQVGWSALLIALFNAHAGIADQNRRAAQLILWLEGLGKHVTNGFPITTLTRLLNAETLSILGFGVRDDELFPELPAADAYMLASRVIDDIAANIINVTRGGGAGSVYSLEAALAYVRRVRDELEPIEATASVDDGGETVTPVGSADVEAEHATPADLEARGVQGGAGGGQSAASASSHGAASVDSVPIAPVDQAAGVAENGVEDGRPATAGPVAATGESETEGDQPAGSSSSAAAKPRSGATVKAAWDRPCLFGRRKNSKADFAFPANRTKVMNVVSELRQLDPNVTPLAVNMLFRALLELSDNAYRAAYDMKPADSLPKSIASSADKMLSEGLLSKEEHEVVTAHTRSERTILHVKSIQRIIHDEASHTNAQALNTMWDSIGCFVRACWAGVMRAET